MGSLLRDVATAMSVGVRAPAAVWPSDIGLFWHSSRTDAAIIASRRQFSARDAFEAAYTRSADPWCSVSPRYRYQRHKYAGLLALLPAGRVYPRVLDLGCGLGPMSRLLAARAGHVLGLDVAQAAVDRARLASRGFGNLEFRQGDAAALPPDLDGRFDLIVVADTLYYLTDLSDPALDAVVGRIADLLVPGGTVLVANHYFSRWDRESRLARRIHDRFIRSPNFTPKAEYRRPFYLANLLEGTRQPG